MEYWNEHFFERDKLDVLDEYQRIIRHTLGDPNPDVSHLAALWDLGYLPLSIRAVPEGTRVPLRVPMLTIENTDPRFFWLTNALETLFSVQVWIQATSATIAAQYRSLLDGWAARTGGDPEFVQFQGHDFSYRGHTSTPSAAASGAGHLLSFVGTDTIPAILYLEAYYGANVENELVGTSVPASEHSVMCAGGRDGELETFRRLITKVHPTGIVSIVSDTWDLWHVLSDTLPQLHDTIMARDGKLVIRPDSGDPVDILCGTMQPHHGDYYLRRPGEETGVIEMLWNEFGGTINEAGYRVLDPHVGAIYGDAITLERARAICSRLADKGFASTNVVFGIGSFTYQYQTRDTFGFAMKSTYVEINGEPRFIQKDPVTDTKGTKKSLTGRVVVARDLPSGRLAVIDNLDRQKQKELHSIDLLQIVFENGVMYNTQTLSEIRGRLQG